MEQTPKEQFEGLVEQFAELLVGDSTPETVESIKLWAIYSHIHKTMPNVTAHWGQVHEEGRAAVRALFEEIKEKNQALREKR